MFKVFGLILAGIILAASGLFMLSTVDFQWPHVEWGNIGFVMLIGSVATFGSAFVVSRV